MAELSGVLVSARAAVSQVLELMALEAQRAGLALMWMVAGGVAAAICLASAWLGLMVVVVLWLAAPGGHWIAAVSVVACLNLLAGVGLVYVCIDRSSDLLFAASRRQVAGRLPAESLS